MREKSDAGRAVVARWTIALRGWWGYAMTQPNDGSSPAPRESVLVCFHAHPDDEVFTTGGVMRLAADAGHRVVLVTATDGAQGEVPQGLLADGERLVDRRRRELETSAKALGVHRLEMLGYPDSGMAGTPENARPEAFCNVDVEVAASRLAQLLVEEGADVLTVYDPHGNYGHPDHIRVHVVGVRAAELAGVTQVYEATVNRDHLARLMASNPQWADEASPPDVSEFGLPESEITTVVDVRAAMPAKRSAMAAHESQVGDFGPFLAMPAEQVEAAFGQESFRRRGGATGQPGGAALETALPL
jgi:LmbE family N-acetylglucosaminyl deacetylase